MAGRIPRSFIDQLLARVDIVTLISQRVRLKRFGSGHWKGLCPFHQEKTPSFSVSPSKQFYYCFGCQAHGNSIDFIMQFEHKSFVEAVELLAETHGLAVPRDEQAQKRHAQRTAGSKLLDQVADYFHQALHQSEEAQRYLHGRGLSGSIMAQFHLGFAPDHQQATQALVAHCIRGRSTSEARTVQQLVATGVLLPPRHGNPWQRVPQRFRGRVIFPIRNPQGHVVGFGGRTLQNDNPPKYLNSPETFLFKKGEILYGLYELQRNRSSSELVVVVEGYMDVVGLAQHGVSDAVAALGTAFTARHAQRLMSLNRPIVLCFDADQAGAKATLRALEACLPLAHDQLDLRVLRLPKGHDPDSWVAEHGAAAFQTACNDASPWYQYLFDVLAEGKNLALAHEKAAYLRDIVAYLHPLPNGLLKHLLWDELAQRLGMTPQQMTRLVRQPTAPAPTTESSQPTPDAWTELALHALTTMALNLEVLKDCEPWWEEPSNKTFDDSASRLWASTLGWLRTQPPNNTPSTAHLLSRWETCGVPKMLLERVHREGSRQGSHDVLTSDAALERVQRTYKRWLQQRRQRQADRMMEAMRRGELSHTEQQELQALLTQIKSSH